MVRDSIRIDDGAGRVLTADRSGLLPVLWTSSEGLDGGLGVRITKTDRLGHGAVVGALTRPGREITVSGIMHGTDSEAREFIRLLSAMWAGNTRGVLTRNVDGLELTADDVILDGPVKLTPTIEDGAATVEWELPLYAGDPLLYGPKRTYRVSTPSADYGLDWPLFINDEVLTWGSGATTVATAQIVNSGTVDAYPVITVHGDFPAGFRVGDGAGRWVAFNRSVTQSAPVVLNFAAHSAAVDGADQSLALTERGFWHIPPAGVCSPTLRAITGGIGYADVAIRDAYL